MTPNTVDGVLVNAVAPIAATRIYSRPVEPGELTPEQAAPGVVFLASPACSVSGLVLRAEGGRFAAAGYDRGSGVDFGREPPTPEAVAERWPEIAR